MVVKLELTEIKPTISDEEIENWINYGIRLSPHDFKIGFREVLDTIINGGFPTVKDWIDFTEAMKP